MFMTQFANFPIGLIGAIMLLGFASFAFFDGARHAHVMASGLGPNRHKFMHSLPGYHGWFHFSLVFVPAIVILLIFNVAKHAIAEAILTSQLPQTFHALSADEKGLFLLDAQKIAFGGQPSQNSPELDLAAAKLVRYEFFIGIGSLLAAAITAIGGYLYSKTTRKISFRARNHVETVVKAIMVFASGIAVLTTFGIILSLLFETIKFFDAYNPLAFLFGTQWSPQIAIRADQVGQSGSFGAVPLFLGTFMIMLIAMCVAVPVGLGAAIYLSEYASEKARTYIKPALELLAGIPTVVYGFFALLTVAPFIKGVGEALGLETSSQSALAAGLVMGVMIIPFISSLSDDVINAVPQSLRDGSYAMGATKSETISRVILPAALPGIIGSVLLAISRALGETMIVAMAAGQNANLSVNPLDMMTTVTVQIVTLLTGDQEYDSPKTHVAFALGFVLFFVTLILNIIALRVVQKYREKYD
jgi:phosphate transport system permease protein